MQYPHQRVEYTFTLVIRSRTLPAPPPPPGPPVGSPAMGRPYATEAVVLRSIRFGEADRVLHLLTRERGRVNAIAKGVRKTTSRFGGRLEPLTLVALTLHEGRGELHT